MRRTRLNLILLAGVLLAVGGWFFFRGSGELRYQGKPVSYWFREFCQTADHPRGAAVGRLRRATVAFHALGTNAVPFLLDRAMNAKAESAGRKAFLEFLSLFPDSFAAPRYVSPEDTRQRALQLLWKAKPQAGMVLPRLSQALSEPNSADFGRAIAILETVEAGSTTLVSYLAAGLRATNAQTRLGVTRRLEGLGLKAAPAVPALAEIVRTTEPTNALFSAAAAALAAIGSNAAPTLPGLRAAWLAETDWRRRLSLAAVLYQINQGEDQAFNLLAGTLTNGQSSTSQVQTAASRLGALGTNAAAAIPALLAAADRPDLDLHSFVCVAEGLSNLGLPPMLLLPKLRARLEVESGLLRLHLAAWVLGISPADAEAQAVLLSQITNGSVWQTYAITRLGLAGTNASGAAPFLLAAFGGTNYSAWPAIPATLTKLGVSPKPLLPQLREKLKTGDDHARAAIAGTVLAIEPRDEVAQSVLMDLIQTRSKQAEWAIHFLSDVGPAASNALPLLRRELKNQNPNVQNAVANAIERIEASRPASAGP